MWLKVVLIAFGISLGAVPAEAKSQCAQRSELVTRLQGFDKKLTGIGTTYDGLLLEVLASKDGNWTILITRSNGRSCIVSHGVDWRSLSVGGGRSANAVFRQAPLMR